MESDINQEIVAKIIYPIITTNIKEEQVIFTCSCIGLLDPCSTKRPMHEQVKEHVVAQN